MSIHNFSATKKIGPFSIEDTGAPPQCSEYKLIVIVHGLAWPSGIFTRLLPFAPQHDARIILVNRRDYPGSTPFSDSERQLLSSCLPTTAEAAQNMRSYMKDRARELYQFLVEVALTEAIPKVSEKGGMIVVGWSLGSAWITALLAHLEEFEAAGIMLQSYARKFILLDPPYGAVGFPHYSNLRMPYEDLSLPPGQGVAMFPEWVSCFYDHHLPPSFPSTPIVNPKVELSLTALSNPPSTFSTLSPADVETIVYPGPALDGGSDCLLFEAGQRLGTFDEMRSQALFGQGRDVLQSSSAVIGTSEMGRSPGDWWKSVEVRVMWCDRSIWPVLWGIQALHRELEDAKAAHKVRIGRVNIVRIRGANHYPHWEEPEQTLRVLLSEDGAEEEETQSAKL